MLGKRVPQMGMTNMKCRHNSQPPDKGYLREKWENSYRQDIREKERISEVRKTMGIERERLGLSKSLGNIYMV